MKYNKNLVKNLDEDFDGDFEKAIDWLVKPIPWYKKMWYKLTQLFKNKEH